MKTFSLLVLLAVGSTYSPHPKGRGGYLEPADGPRATVRWVLHANNDKRQIQFQVCKQDCRKDGFLVAERNVSLFPTRALKGSRFPQPVDNDKPVETIVRADQSLLFQTDSFGRKACAFVGRFRPEPDATYEVVFTDDNELCRLEVDRIAMATDGTRVSTPVHFCDAYAEPNCID